MKIGDLNDGLVIESEEHITKEGLSNSAARLVQPGALLVALYGSIGKLGVNAVECATNQAIAHFIPAPSTVDRDFAFWAILKHRDDLVSLGQGGTQQNISQKIIKDFAIPLPPLNEQRRIVARLQELTTRTKAARAALEAIPPLLDRFRQSVLAAAFRGDLTADWRAKNPDVEPASELLKRIRAERRQRWEEAELEKMRAKGKVPGDDRWKARYVEPEGVDAEGLPELPEGWVWATVEQAAFVNLGRQRSPRNHNGPHMRPYLRAANVTWTGIDISDVREMNFDPTEVTGYLLEPGDILLSEGSGSAREVGKPAVFRGEVTGCCFQNTLVRVRCPVLALVEWLHLHFLCDALSGRFASLSRGIGIHHIGREGIAQWPVAIPPLEEQRRILASVGQALESTEVTVTKVSAISTALDHLHQSLLSKAFRGELVPQDPADEPASVLLERIRQEREAAGANGKSRRGRKAKQESSRAGVPILAEESPVRLAESEV